MNQHLLDAYNSTLDGDEWGNVQAWRFATAHVLHHMDVHIDEWKYTHSDVCAAAVNQDENFEESEILYLMDYDRKVALQDLITFGDMLNNLRDILVDEGKDY